MKRVLLFACYIFAFAYTNAQSPSFEWAKNIESSGAYNIDNATSLAIDSTGNVYCLGTFRGTSDFDPGVGTFNLTSESNSDDIYILKLDVSGNFLWVKQMGGTLEDKSGSVILDKSGNIYMTGAFQDTVDFNPGTDTFHLNSFGSFDIFVLKLDPSGNFLWAKQMGGLTDDEATYATLDASGNIYTTGFFEGITDFDPSIATFNMTALGNSDIFISKLDSSGNFLWAKQIGSYTNSGSSIAADTTSGDVYITGYFAGSSDFDPGSGTFYLNSSSYADMDAFVLKLDANGNFKWAKDIGGPSTQCGSSIYVKSSTSIYTVGYFYGTTDFDPGIGTYNLISAGDADFFITKLDTAGNFIWIKQIEGPSTDNTFYITVDKFGNVYTTGLFQGTTDFNPTGGSYNLTSVGGGDAFIFKLSQSTITSIAEKSVSINKIFAYPNPTNGLLNIQIPKLENNMGIEVYNSLGTLIYAKANIAELNVIEFGNQTSGLYFVKVVSNNKIIATQEIMKE